MKYGKHHRIISNEKQKSVRNKNVSQSNIKNNNRIRTRKQTKVGAKTINPVAWIIRILIILIILLCLFNINGILSYFTDTATSTNEFSIDANYTVTFNNNTGTGIMSEQIISYNVATNLTANSFTKDGYSFDNWNTESDGSGTTYSNEDLVTNISDTTLYAQWNMDTYNIAYALNSGTVATANPETYNVETASFTLNNPSKTGYTFKGWSGTGLTGDTNTTVTIPLGSTGDKSYTANYTANTYYIKFNSNGGSNSMSNQTMTYDTPANLTANNFTRKGYTFTGWNTKSDGSGTSYSNQEQIINLSNTNGENINLYAIWKEKFYTVTYSSNVQALLLSQMPNTIQDWEKFEIDINADETSGISVVMDNRILTLGVDYILEYNKLTINNVTGNIKIDLIETASGSSVKMTTEWIDEYTVEVTLNGKANQAIYVRIYKGDIYISSSATDLYVKQYAENPLFHKGEKVFISYTPISGTANLISSFTIKLRDTKTSCAALSTAELIAQTSKKTNFYINQPTTRTGVLEENSSYISMYSVAGNEYNNFRFRIYYGVVENN